MKDLTQNDWVKLSVLLHVLDVYLPDLNAPYKKTADEWKKIAVQMVNETSPKGEQL
jgi:hypothetical protein